VLTKDGIVKKPIDLCGSELLEGAGIVKQLGRVKLGAKTNLDALTLPENNQAAWSDLG